MDNEETPKSEFILYQTEDGRTRIQCRFENETIWLTQALIAELFQVTVPTVNEHLKGIVEDGELEPGATIRKFRIVRTEGKREVSREIEHYNLAAILAVGYRVRSHRGTPFCQWATARLSEYLVKGFAMDHYVTVGVEELDQEKLTPLLRLKYDSISDAIADLGGKADEIGRVFAGFQKYLYKAS